MRSLKHLRDVKILIEKSGSAGMWQWAWETGLGDSNQSKKKEHFPSCACMVWSVGEPAYIVLHGVTRVHLLRKLTMCVVVVNLR